MQSIEDRVWSGALSNCVKRELAALPCVSAGTRSLVAKSCAEEMPVNRQLCACVIHLCHGWCFLFLCGVFRSSQRAAKQAWRKMSRTPNIFSRQNPCNFCFTLQESELCPLVAEKRRNKSKTIRNLQSYLQPRSRIRTCLQSDLCCQWNSTDFHAEGLLCCRQCFLAAGRNSKRHLCSS